MVADVDGPDGVCAFLDGFKEVGAVEQECFLYLVVEKKISISRLVVLLRGFEGKPKTL